MDLSNGALQLIWNLIGPQGRAALNPAEIEAAQELRVYVQAEAKRRETPGESPKG